MLNCVRWSFHSGVNFEVLTGFELTEEQLAFNRSGKRFLMNVGVERAARGAEAAGQRGRAQAAPDAVGLFPAGFLPIGPSKIGERGSFR